MDYRILGPLEVRDGGRPVPLGGPKQRAVLAILLLHRNEVVSIDRLIDGLWGEAPPASAPRTLHAYVSRLRKALAANGIAPTVVEDSAQDVLVTRGHGYLLRLAPGELDAELFAQWLRDGREALEQGNPARAGDSISRALALWRGEPLAEVAFEDFAQAEIRRLEELRLVALETRIEAELQRGRHAELIGELEGLLAQHPTRERIVEQLMIALYRAGRQADALEVYQRIRVGLAEELGLEPGPTLKALHSDILEHASALQRAGGSGPAAVPPVFRRRVLSPATPTIGAERDNGRGVTWRPLTGAQRLIQRDALFERLSATEGGGVVLVCAAAGSGKTVLLRSWIEAAGLEDRVGWASVERGERDAQRFWLSVIDALAGAIGVVQRVAPAPTFNGRAVVEQVLGDLESLEDPGILVIDDLHELDSADALRWLEIFLARLGWGLRVVLATREDPRLGLHRLRLSGQLTELRAPDLRFSLEQTVELLRAEGINLSGQAAALLYERTEGWVAGLRLAAISLAHHPDPERFVTEFSGSERNVAGYLLAEVLDRQPPEVRDMLLRTSLLERVCAPLADFLTEGAGAERLLQELEDANAFVTSLDARRSWFRYHHLFADLLQLELRRAAPGLVGSLHRAAAEWHEQQGLIIEAIRHAQAAGDWPLASRLLADHHIDLTFDGHTGSIAQLLSMFPDDLVAVDPELALAFASARLLDGALEQSAGYVALAGRLADKVPDGSRPRFEVLSTAVTITLARWRGDLETALETRPSLEAALAAQPPGDRALNDEMRSVALQNLGVAELWSLRLDDARRDLEQGLALARRAGRPWLEIPCLAHLAMAGPLTDLSLSGGLELSQEAVRIVDVHGWVDDPVVVTALATGAMILLWQGRFDEAEQWLERAERALHPGGEPGTELIVRLDRGLLRLAQGCLEEALSALRAAERMQAMLAGPHAFWPAVRARLLQTEVYMGRLAAVRTALSQISREERDAGDLRIATAVLHLAAGEAERAIDVVAPVLDGSAPLIHRPSAITEAQVLDALAREQLGDRLAAEASLELALDVAEPHGIVLPFVIAPARDLLEELPRHHTAHATLWQTILDALAGPQPH